MPKRKHSDVAEVAGTSHDSDNEEDLHFSDDEGTHVDGIYIPPPIKPVCSFDPKGPRLIITKIVNNFFKSYAKEIELGPFHKCFNAIVGPNGSGKSNVIDSMLFVFGYRATKIRSKKVSVLLHNSEQFRNVQSATVEVHFALIVDKEGDEYDIVPDSEFVVSRTANKDNSSFYQLNGRKVQFKEVAKLLRGHGIDLDHNRFLILQGEVEQIAMMKCKGENEHESGMLEYLEDIIGTTRYKKPLFLLDERVEALSGVRSEKINRLKLVENELEELKAPLEEAVGFLKAENTIIACKNVLIQKNIFDLEDQSKEVEEEKNVVSEEHKQLNENLKALTEEKSKNEAIIQKETAKYASLEKRKESLKEAFDKANNKDIKMQADMVQINTNRKKTKQLLAEERKKLEKLERQPEESRQGIAECEEKEKEHTAEKLKLEAEKAKMLLTLGDQTKELQEQKEVLETELVDLKKVVNEAKSAFTLAESELKLCLSNEETERTKFENIRSTFENSTRLFKERSTAVEQLKKKIPLTEKSIRGAQEELNIMRGEEQQVKIEIMKKRSSLEESRSAMQSSKSRNKVLDALTKQKQEGNCDGFFGRLGDLGAIDQKYDVAVSTACGPLDNIVVDTVTTAQWCIEFLKQYDIGRATFIALEKQEHLRQHANSKIRTPENVPRLFDLIRVQDERVKPAFYYALRDTLVANDLEQATKIAYGAQRFRVVTLKGDLIETTGTMSGGGKSVSRGRMGQSVAVCNVNPRDLETLEQEIDTFEKHFRDLREKQTTVERQLSALEPEFRQMKIDYEKYTIELQSLKQQLPLLSKQLEAQEAKAKSTKSDPQQVKKLSAVVEKKKVEFEKANETAGELQVKVDALTKEIKDKTIGKIKTMDKNISDVAKKIEKCKAEITRLTVAVKTAERNAKKAMEKVATMEQDIENAEKRLRQMKTEREEIESDAEKLMKCIEEVTEQLAEGEGEYADLKKIVEKLTKKETKLRSEKVDVDQKLKTVEKKFSDITAQMHQLNVKLSQLKLQDVPNETFEELKKFTREEMDSKNIGTVEHDLKVAEHLLKSTKPNLSVIQEFRKKQDMYMSRAQELDEISTKRTEMKNLYEKLRNQRKDEFLVGFGIIRLKLKEMYQMITLGGDADFELVDTFDPFTEGIQFNVRPPKKSWKKIANLSGGEKTLSSLALVFALHYYKPSPLYVMDEIDAALDFKNVSIVGHYIKERTKNAQFIIISLRSNMFELCDNLIGIFKIHNCTQTITINPRIYEQESTKEDQVVPSNKDKDTVFDALKSSTSNKTAPASKNVAEGAEILEESMTVSEESIIPQSQEDQVIEDSFQSSEKMSDETIDQFFH